MSKLDFINDINKEYKAAMGYDRIDQLMVKILWWHFGVFVIVAVMASYFKIAEYYPSPFSWRVITLPEAAISVVIGLIATLIAAFLYKKISNHYIYRMIITTSLTIFSYLFVFISGGSIEMHFHFFMIVALLIIYADWRLGWLLLVLTGLHHVILNYFEPGWVYFYGRNDFAVIAHAVPVLAAVIFTTILCSYSRRNLVALAEARKSLEVTVTERTKQLQEANHSLEEKVGERTAQLQEKLSEVQKLNEVMVGREVKMAEQKAEIEKLKDNPAGA
jgi:hypothetical protein